MTMARAPLTPIASRKVFMLVMRMTPATAVPRMRAGRIRTMYAATGAATTPPSRSAPTTVQGTSAKLKEIRNPTLALNATTNSLVSTVPTTLRGSIRRDERRVGVEIGPHPHHRLLPPPEREPREDVDAEREQEDRHDGLGGLSGDDRGQDHGPQERADAARDGQPPHLAPVDVAEPPVRDPACQRGAYLGHVHARRGERRCEPYRQ